MIKIRGQYRTKQPYHRAVGSDYGPLASDGFGYLCPDCGGYGLVPASKSMYASGRTKCDFCSGKGHLPLDDPRVFVVGDGP